MTTNAAAEAISAVAAVYGAPNGTEYRAAAVEESPLWRVTVAMTEGQWAPHNWPRYYVGPDRRVFAISGDTAVHDSELAERLLTELYREGVTGSVDPAHFADRLQRLTQDREQLVRQVVAEARAGQLRPPTLPLP